MTRFAGPPIRLTRRERRHPLCGQLWALRCIQRAAVPAEQDTLARPMGPVLGGSEEQILEDVAWLARYLVVLARQNKPEGQK